jgi:ribose 5-phosphate isomerase A
VTQGGEAEAERQRRAAGETAAGLVPDDSTIGFGTGRAATAALEALARRMREGLRVRGVPTSLRTAETARKLGLTLVSLEEAGPIDLVIDGVDEVDPALQVLKGGGGALTREKLVALSARERVLVLEESKRVARLGETRGLPIELLAFGWPQTLARIAEVLPGALLRRNPDGTPTASDNGALLCDAPIPLGADLRALGREVKLVSGVVEHGLFLDLSPTLVIGGPSGVRVLR